LGRYPDGLFADVAGQRLAAIDAARRDAVAAEERQAWERALRTNTVEGFRNYLTKYPNGAFADEARIIIEEQTVNAGNEAARAAAEAEEASLNLNPLIRTLVESRLAGLGLQPGAADGSFDDNTRRAIRRYQQARNLPVTGYLTRQTLVGLMAGAL
ncbi:MAG: peptidoglycan-binding domain-containing protein, partial [Albidovulum sp.]